MRNFSFNKLHYCLLFIIAIEVNLFCQSNTVTSNDAISPIDRPLFSENITNKILILNEERIIEITGEGTNKILVYKVKLNDTLWDISRACLDDPSDWPELLKYNNIKNPDFIYPGDELRVPLKKILIILKMVTSEEDIALIKSIHEAKASFEYIESSENTNKYHWGDKQHYLDLSAAKLFIYRNNGHYLTNRKKIISSSSGREDITKLDANGRVYDFLDIEGSYEDIQSDTADDYARVHILLKSKIFELFYGDYNAAAKGCTLPLKSKQVNGVRGSFFNKFLQFDGQYARKKGKAEIETITGDGSQGPFYLKWPKVIFNSEIIRYGDANNAFNRVLLKRDIDYIIDYREGSIKLLGWLLEEDMVLDVRYEHSEGAGNLPVQFYTAGVNISSDKIYNGGFHILDERDLRGDTYNPEIPIKKNTILAHNGVFTIKDFTLLDYEYNHCFKSTELDNRSIEKDGFAFRAKTGVKKEAIDLNAEVIHTEPNFSPVGTVDYTEDSTAVHAEGRLNAPKEVYILSSSYNWRQSYGDGISDMEKEFALGNDFRIITNTRLNLRFSTSSSEQSNTIEKIKYDTTSTVYDGEAILDMKGRIMSHQLSGVMSYDQKHNIKSTNTAAYGAGYALSLYKIKNVNISLDTGAQVTTDSGFHKYLTENYKSAARLAFSLSNTTVSASILYNKYIHHTLRISRPVFIGELRLNSEPFEALTLDADARREYTREYQYTNVLFFTDDSVFGGMVFRPAPVLEATYNISWKSTFNRTIQKRTSSRTDHLMRLKITPVDPLAVVTRLDMINQRTIHSGMREYGLRKDIYLRPGKIIDTDLYGAYRHSEQTYYIQEKAQSLQMKHSTNITISGGILFQMRRLRVFYPETGYDFNRLIMGEEEHSTDSHSILAGFLLQPGSVVSFRVRNRYTLTAAGEKEYGQNALSGDLTIQIGPALYASTMLSVLYDSRTPARQEYDFSFQLQASF